MFPDRGFTGWASDFGGPQHGDVVGHRDDAKREKEGEQAGGEEHHLD